jgi:putative MFS transporter
VHESAIARRYQEAVPRLLWLEPIRRRIFVYIPCLIEGDVNMNQRSLDLVPSDQTQTELLGRLDDLPFSLWHGLSASAIFFAILLDVFDNFNIAFALPPLRTEWTLTPVQVGFLGSIALLGLALGALIIPGLADRLGRKWPFIVAVTGFSVMSLACGLARDYPQLLIYRFITGIFIGGAAPLSFTYLAEIAGRRFRGRLVALATIGSTVALICVPVAAGILIPVHGWRSIFYASFALGIISVAWCLIILKESVPYLVDRNRMVDAARILAFFEKNPRSSLGQPSRRQATATEQIAVPTMKARHSYFVSLWRPDIRMVTMIAWTLNATTLFGLTGAAIWLPTLLTNLGLGQESFRIVFIGSFGSLVGAVLALLLVDNWGRKPLLVIAAVGTLVFYPLLGAMGTATLIGIVAFLAQMCSAGIIFPPLYAWLNENYPSEIRASGMGWSQVPGRVAGFLAPNAVGLVVAAGWGFQAVGVVLGVPSLVSALLVLGWARESKGRYLNPG